METTYAPLGILDNSLHHNVPPSHRGMSAPGLGFNRVIKSSYQRMSATNLPSYSDAFDLSRALRLAAHTPTSTGQLPHVTTREPNKRRLRGSLDEWLKRSRVESTNPTSSGVVPFNHGQRTELDAATTNKDIIDSEDEMPHQGKRQRPREPATQVISDSEDERPRQGKGRRLMVRKIQATPDPEDDNDEVSLEAMAYQEKERQRGLEASVSSQSTTHHVPVTSTNTSPTLPVAIQNQPVHLPVGHTTLSERIQKLYESFPNAMVDHIVLKWGNADTYTEVRVCISKRTVLVPNVITLLVGDWLSRGSREFKDAREELLNSTTSIYKTGKGSGMSEHAPIEALKPWAASNGMPPAIELHVERRSANVCCRADVKSVNRTANS
ncbi:hypothetical protein IQ07DRAFT_633021 [Pyrenochaeta sp. DS3sAY3a]|nr:hypothetical protein IQ07DRAFT_633021 [Pyrenochaeta sp. DS3sAY3a]